MGLNLHESREAFVESLVQSERFATAEAVVDEALRHQARDLRTEASPALADKWLTGV